MKQSPKLLVVANENYETFKSEVDNLQDATSQFPISIKNKLSLGDGENVFKTEEDGWSLI